MMDWGGRGEHMTTGGWIFMVLGMLVLLVLIVVLVIWIVSQQHRPGTRLSPGASAREVLDHRLVSGEITPDQYDQLRNKLEPLPPSPDAPASPPPAAASG